MRSQPEKLKASISNARKSKGRLLLFIFISIFLLDFTSRFSILITGTQGPKGNTYSVFQINKVVQIVEILG